MILQYLNLDVYVSFLVLKHVHAVSQDFVSLLGEDVLLLYFMAKPEMDFSLCNLNKLVFRAT